MTYFYNHTTHDCWLASPGLGTKDCDEVACGLPCARDYNKMAHGLLCARNCDEVAH